MANGVTFDGALVNEDYAAQIKEDAVIAMNNPRTISITCTDFTEGYSLFVWATRTSEQTVHAVSGNMVNCRVDEYYNQAPGCPPFACIDAQCFRCWDYW